MRFWKRLKAHRDDAQPLPAEIYISLVDALFKDARSLYVGSLAASITALITAWKTGELKGYEHNFQNGTLHLIGPDPSADGQAVLSIGELKPAVAPAGKPTTLKVTFEPG